MLWPSPNAWRYASSLISSGSRSGDGDLYALQEHRDHRDIPLESSGNFVVYEVRGIFEATIAFAVFGIKPTRADKREEEIARFEPLVENVTKILPWSDIVHIHEHRTLAHQSTRSFFSALA